MQSYDNPLQSKYHISLNNATLRDGEAFSLLPKQKTINFYSIQKPVSESMKTYIENQPRSLVRTLFIQTLDVISYERNVYTVLNFLGDVGALVSVLTGFASMFLYNVMQLDLLWENHVINNVFRQRPHTDLEKPLHLKITFFQALKQKVCSSRLCKNEQAKKR